MRIKGIGLNVMSLHKIVLQSDLVQEKSGSGGAFDSIDSKHICFILLLGAKQPIVLAYHDHQLQFRPATLTLNFFVLFHYHLCGIGH